MKKITFLLLLVTSIGFAQDLNQYKYVLVPAKFSFLKEKNQYNLNLLSKMYMQQFGFETYFDNDEAPNDFFENNCNKIYFDVLENNNMFSTKLTVVLKDCKGKVLFTSKEGSNKEKEYKTAYNLALREAFNSMKTIQYKYAGDKVVEENKVVQETKIEVQNQSLNSENLVSSQLFAQPITNGFQLINAEPKVIYKIYKTSVKDLYLAAKGNLQGVLISKNNEWFFEYYQNEKLLSEKVEVKL
ncbi:MAG: hypothetical protein O9267_10690 [Flavobacterium sp.]|uniref:hypothetical protein n=1 Tax=Flavobacterium sp. TaxID=239 RepID=UPI0022CCE9B3|nr:hypothetical protein [Flavobacterium sp.]MCZ8198064.1 hypothetical protein [Flavobacterium sp.]